jgi:NDP-mannose synthase
MGSGDSRRTAVILAGGRGTRLSPYTAVLPKPLMPIGDQAIIEIVVHQLRMAGFTDIHLAVGHLGHLIRAVLGDGHSHGVRVTYHMESAPMGTVGPLTGIDGLDEPFLMMNGDVLSTIDYAALYRAHCESGSLMTIATHPQVEPTEFGVIHLDGSADAGLRRVAGFEEKPEISYVVSTGVYVLDPAVMPYVPQGRPSDVPDLIQCLVDAREPVLAFSHDGFWLDIGRPQDFQLANQEYERLRPLLFGEKAERRPPRVFLYGGPDSTDPPPADAPGPPDAVVSGQGMSGERALRALAHDPPDVVVMRLAGAAGTAVEEISRISEVAPGAGVVALVAASPDAVRERLHPGTAIVLPADAPTDQVRRALHTVDEMRHLFSTGAMA